MRVREPAEREQRLLLCGGGLERGWQALRSADEEGDAAAALLNLGVEQLLELDAAVLRAALIQHDARLSALPRFAPAGLERGVIAHPLALERHYGPEPRHVDVDGRLEPLLLVLADAH
eukprot:6878432-Prymnesium_polylepis.1